MSAPTKARRPRSTSTAGLRAARVKPQHRIPVERRGTLPAPCDLCGEVRTVQFDDGLCAPCRGDQQRAAQADHEQDRLREAVAMLAALDALEADRG